MSDYLEYKGYKGTIEYSKEDEILCGSVVNADVLITYEGESLKALKEDFREAIDDYLAICEADGLHVSPPCDDNIRVSAETQEKLKMHSI